MIGHNPEIIAAFSTTAARPAKQATGTIPIVGIAMADPVGDDLVASLARPGGNVTGTTFLGPQLVAKRLQLLREVVPGLSRVAALWHPNAYSERTMTGIVNDCGPDPGITASTRARRWPGRLCQRVRCNY